LVLPREDYFCKPAVQLRTTVMGAAGDAGGPDDGAALRVRGGTRAGKRPEAIFYCIPIGLGV
jgi:hypothetical protein